MFPSIKKAKIFFTVWTILNIPLTVCTLVLFLIGKFYGKDMFDLIEAFPQLLFGHIVTIPALLISVTVFLHSLHKELKEESSSLNGRIATLERKTEELT